MPIVLTWSELFMFHHEFTDGKQRPSTEESPLPEARRCACRKVGYTNVSVKW